MQLSEEEEWLPETAVKARKRLHDGSCDRQLKFV